MKNKSRPNLPKIITSFERKPSPVTAAGTIDSDGVQLSEQGTTYSLGDFETIRELGSGAQGVVSEVQHVKTSARFAMKITRLQQDEATVKKQMAELRTLRRLSHANVVGLVDVFYREGSIFTLLELMDCGTLQDLLQMCRRIPEKFLAQITLQVLDGLAYIHKECHVLHRDIKPANILLNSDGFVKISDFGVSGVVESTVGNATTFTGSSAYMSPERLQGEAHRLSSDCWSLGMIVLECALGYYPFADPPSESSKNTAASLSVFSLMQLISSADPCAKLKTLPVEEFSAEFADFVTRCLVRDPAKRPSSTELLQHPWIVHARADTKTNFKDWMWKMMDQRR